MSGDHDHPHPHQPDLEDAPASESELLAQAVEELLIEKGVITAADMRRSIEGADAKSPMNGARLVARCWVDPAFEQRMLASVNDAARELGLELGPVEVRAVRDSERVHNVIVCTLCSCYPVALLGPSPDWYKSRAYRSRVVREPRAVLAEFGTEVADDVELRVHDSSADLRYLVIPRRPAGTEGLSEEALAALVTRDCMIGTALPHAPSRG
jgi:nitrile hydratase alpha subunit